MGGKVPESVFKSLSIDASMYIKRNTYNRIDENNVPDSVKLCMCSLVDKMNNIQKQAGKKSETVGSWSATYLENKEWSNELYDVLVNYLLNEKDSKGVSLLYRGC